MAAFDWRSIVTKLAPTVGAAIAGPLGAGVLGTLSQIILGRPDGTKDDLAEAVVTGSVTPEMLLQIKQLEADLRKHESEMGFKYADLQFQTEKLYIEDVQNARARQIATNDTVPQWILVCAFLFYVFQFYVFIYAHLPSDEFTRALIVRGFGTVDGILIMCVSFFVGSSKGSKSAGESLQRIAETPTPPPVVVRSNGNTIVQ